MSATMDHDDFRGFVRYMTSLWGALGGAAVFFPMADVLLRVIPIPADSYGNSPASIAIPVTSLVAAFTLLHTFVQCDRPGSTSTRKAGLYFALGLVSLLVFFLLEHFEYSLRSRLLPDLDSTDDYILILVGLVPFYTAFFACVTRAFAILALIEFKRRSRQSPGGTDGT